MVRESMEYPCATSSSQRKVARRGGNEFRDLRERQFHAWCSAAPACSHSNPAARKRLARDFHVVKGMRSFARDLHLLVSLAGEQHDVSGARFADGQRNRFAAVDFDGVFHAGLLQTHQRVVDDGARIFAARIVGSEHDEIAASSRGLAHQRTLGAIAIAAATEHGMTRAVPPPRVTNSRASAVRLRRASSVCA